MIQKRKKTNSSKVNLIISAVFHSVLIGVIFYFAAKQGLLGKKLKTLTATLEKPKKIEQEKQKPQEPKPEEHKTDQAKASVPQPKADTAPPRAMPVAAEAAPAPAVVPAFAFSDGAIEVSSLDENGRYKNLVERTLKSYWNRPQDAADDSYTAQVELTIDKTGYVQDSRFVSGSGDANWDQTVKDAVAQLKSINGAPPKNFPHKFVVRFDVESSASDGIQLGSQ